MDENSKTLDRQKIETYLSGRESVTVKELIENSGANKLRVFPILFEMQLDNKLMVQEEDSFGRPLCVSFVDFLQPENPFSTEFLDSLMELAKKNHRKRMNYNLHDSLEAPAQRLLYALDMGTEFSIHRHRNTAETYVILRGTVDLIFYDENGNEQYRIEMSAKKGTFGGQIPIGQYHTLEVKEPSIIVLIKDGPYEPSAEQDILSR